MNEDCQNITLGNLNKSNQKNPEPTFPSEIRTNNEMTRIIDYSASNMSSINIFDTTNIQRVDSRSNSDNDDINVNMFTQLVNVPGDSSQDDSSFNMVHCKFNGLVTDLVQANQ